MCNYRFSLSRDDRQLATERLNNGSPYRRIGWAYANYFLILLGYGDDECHKLACKSCRVSCVVCVLRARRVVERVYMLSFRPRVDILNGTTMRRAEIKCCWPSVNATHATPICSSAELRTTTQYLPLFRFITFFFATYNRRAEFRDRNRRQQPLLSLIGRQ